MKRDYKAIGDWCVDAHHVTATELPESVACLQLETIRKHSGRPTIVEVARDLAEGLDWLPAERRLAAQQMLQERHGFGFDMFRDRERLRITKLLGRGRIRSEAEYRTVLDALSDTTIDPSTARALRDVLALHEAER